MKNDRELDKELQKNAKQFLANVKTNAIRMDLDTWQVVGQVVAEVQVLLVKYLVIRAKQSISGRLSG